MLAQDFHADGALPGDHFGIVEGMDECEFFLLFQFARMGVGGVVGVAGQHHLATARPDRIHLDRWRRRRHDDNGPAADLRRRQCQPLRVVAGGGADDTALQTLRRELGQLVVSPAQLEGEHRLHVLALDQQRVADAGRQIGGQVERRFDRYVVNLRGEDFFEIIGSHEEPVLCG